MLAEEAQGGGFFPIPHGVSFPSAANAIIGYGVVEKYSGRSSMGEYQISFQNGPADPADRAPFDKLRIRLLRRSTDVDNGVGLLLLWRVINSLNTLIGAQPLPRHPYAGWSVGEILTVSNFPPDPTTRKYSSLALARFIKHTLPLDTDQGPTFVTSFRELLNH